ncbi:MAG TPA: hypothetical protein VFX21_15045 [Acidimicrobiia bacterium]|nr:hypothetical protein [Acidimicrobiia bacterium]
MKPTTIMSLLSAVLIAVGVIFLGVYFFADREGGKEWFYWAAPLLLIAFGGMLGSLVRQYWVRVGKLETKGRPRSA